MAPTQAREREYIVVVRRAEEGGFWIEVPALPGCFAQGETIDDALADARDAIQSHLAALEADGQSDSPEETMIATVAVSA